MSTQKSASVIVFGDIGRSPRMRNHAIQLSQAGYFVYFVGEKENKINASVSENQNIQIVDLKSPLIASLKRLPRILYLLYAALRIFLQTMQLFYIYLFKLPSLEFILIQNPPSIPVLSTLAIVCWIRKIKMVVDFHNYGYTILALSLKQRLILKLATSYEKFFGKKCDLAFCVSDAMKQDLQENWGIKATTLYDKANTSVFGPISLEEQHSLFLRLGFGELLTSQSEGVISTKVDRPLLLVSSTSWTKDEDFGILLEAMEAYENSAEVNAKDSQFPKLFLLITGKGPEKAGYEKIIQTKQSTWKNIKIQTIWLEPEDYPKLLASADIGVCLHYSSSGLDLPMKVVDMLGSGIPVFAISYQCIGELVQEGVEGFIFKDSKSLTDLFLKYFKQSEQNVQIFKKLRVNAAKFRQFTWETEWTSKALPLLSNFRKEQTTKIGKTKEKKN